MARAGRQPKKRSRGSVLTKLLILVILAAIGLQLRSLHSQVQDAQAQRDALTARRTALAAQEKALTDRLLPNRKAADLYRQHAAARAELDASGGEVA